MGYSKETAERYVRNHGIIDDKKKAIELLCEQSWYWYAIDEDLKEDLEIKMFFQPMGYRLGYDFDACTASDFSVYYCEEGFKKGFGLNDVNSGKILLLPCEFRLSQDEEKQYLSIQKEMLSHIRYLPGEYMDLIKFSKEIFSWISHYDIMQCPWISYSIAPVYMFDRGCLKELATPYLEGETGNVFIKK